MDSHAVIASLPVAGADRSVLIDVANAAFETVLERIEPNNEALTRSLWDAGDYVDNQLFTDLNTPDKLPMPREKLHITLTYSWCITSLDWQPKRTGRSPNPALDLAGCSKL
ncbi:hypothetical protein [Mesorhizobium sp.]|nr:hypothetical protein [Mesorhizobium sp.]